MTCLLQCKTIQWSGQLHWLLGCRLCLANSTSLKLNICFKRNNKMALQQISPDFVAVYVITCLCAFRIAELPIAYTFRKIKSFTMLMELDIHIIHFWHCWQTGDKYLNITVICNLQKGCWRITSITIFHVKVKRQQLANVANMNCKHSSWKFKTGNWKRSLWIMGNLTVQE